MDLHYSQTTARAVSLSASLNPLWIYTTLKPDKVIQIAKAEFESPMDLHYSQTTPSWHGFLGAFESPMDLHYSQTM